MMAATSAARHRHAALAILLLLVGNAAAQWYNPASWFGDDEDDQPAPKFKPKAKAGGIPSQRAQRQQRQQQERHPPPSSRSPNRGGSGNSGRGGKPTILFELPKPGQTFSVDEKVPMKFRVQNFKMSDEAGAAMVMVAGQEVGKFTENPVARELEIRQPGQFEMSIILIDADDQEIGVEETVSFTIVDDDPDFGAQSQQQQQQRSPPSRQRQQQQQQQQSDDWDDFDDEPQQQQQQRTPPPARQQQRRQPPPPPSQDDWDDFDDEQPAPPPPAPRPGHQASPPPARQQQEDDWDDWEEPAQQQQQQQQQQQRQQRPSQGSRSAAPPTPQRTTATRKSNVDLRGPDGKLPVINIFRPLNGSNFKDGHDVVVEVVVDDFEIPQRGKFSLHVNGVHLHTSEEQRLAVVIPGLPSTTFQTEIRLLDPNGDELGVVETVSFSVGEAQAWELRAGDVITDVMESDSPDTACNVGLENYEYIPTETLDFIRRKVIDGIANQKASGAKAKALASVRESCLDEITYRKETFRKFAFERVFNGNRGGCWLGKKSASGWASDPENAVGAVQAVQSVLGEQGVESMLDLGCGDLKWIDTCDLGTTTYHGVEIVDALTQENKDNHPDDKFSFETADMVTYKPSKAYDLVLIRDALQHNTLHDVAQTLCNVHASGSKWLLITSETNTMSNTDEFQFGRAHYHPIAFSIPPFNLGSATESYDESEMNPGMSGRSLQLYEVKELDDFCSGDWSAAVDQHVSQAKAELDEVADKEMEETLSKREAEKYGGSSGGGQQAQGGGSKRQTRQQQQRQPPRRQQQQRQQQPPSDDWDDFGDDEWDAPAPATGRQPAQKQQRRAPAPAPAPSGTDDWDDWEDDGNAARVPPPPPPPPKPKALPKHQQEKLDKQKAASGGDDDWDDWDAPAAATAAPTGGQQAAAANMGAVGGDDDWDDWDAPAPAPAPKPAPAPARKPAQPAPAPAPAAGGDDDWDDWDAPAPAPAQTGKAPASNDDDWDDWN